MGWDPIWTSAVLLAAMGAVAGFLWVARRRRLRQRHAEALYFTASAGLDPYPVVWVTENGVPIAPLMTPEEQFHSHDVHHPMDHTVAGQEWHTWPAGACPCNNGARLNPIPTAVIDQIGVSFKDAAEGISIAFMENIPPS